MYWGVSLKVLLALATSVAIFFAGWFANGWRWEVKLLSVEKQYAEQRLAAEQEARRKELALAESARIEEEKRNAEMERISSELDTALGELRKRPSRVSNSSCTTSSANGSQLSREDAEFLARESARADAAVAALNECYSRYESARSLLNKGLP